MEPHHDLMSAAAIRTLTNSIWVFPYLAVMGMIWGYLAAEASGVIIGLLIAAVTSVIIGTATEISSDPSAGGAVKRRYDQHGTIPPRLT